MSSITQSNPSPATSGSQNSEDVVDTQSTSPILQLTLEIECNEMSRSQAHNLYISHFLSMWNVRTYEFAAIIFTATAYPDTLAATSIRGIARTLASILFSSMLGRWVDQNPSRLKTLMSTISANRGAVICASVLWYFIVMADASPPSAIVYDENGILSFVMLKDIIFTLILLLGILETLSASGNILSMERDVCRKPSYLHRTFLYRPTQSPELTCLKWIVTAASPDGHTYDLTHLNSVMRRIDLICKLIAPILISIAISCTTARIGVLVVGVMSAISWPVEMFCAKRVWNRNPQLQAPKICSIDDSQERQAIVGPLGVMNYVFQGLRSYIQEFKNYFSSTVCIPSFALALLHLSALSYSATFITFLLSTGYSLHLITIARAAGSVVEISSTIVAPVGVQYLGKARNHGRFRGRDVLGENDAEGLLLVDRAEDIEGRTETGLERLGLWGLSWQLLNLIPVVLALWCLSSESVSTEPGFGSGQIPVSDFSNILTRLIPPPSPTILAFSLFTFLSLSRLGLWIFDLTTQQLTQTLTSPTSRSSFTGVEYSLISLFELAQNVLAIVLSRPQDFKWIAVISLLAVCVSTVVYAAWVGKMRGHLVHWERLGKGCKIMPTLQRFPSSFT
ncbi:related to ferroportin 1 [Rhynchosporium agropyri]|uniref:Solute carrier family 40 member n=1 Tax=Rhynchosporium agropyri TaxID=914238 RepID=A0A1E1KX04_9HELO|nr:related to ferroportin 1 [Rhynchosporium agropyri]